MAATRFLALALFMIFLENGAFLGKPLHLDPTMHSCSVRYTRVLTMKSKELDYALVGFQFVVSVRCTRHLRIRRSTTAWGKRGHLLLAPREDYVCIDITVCVDVETNPGPNASEAQLVSSSMNYNVSYGTTALLALRKRATKPPYSVMETLKITGILRYRGCRAGKSKPARCNKITTVLGRRNTDNPNRRLPCNTYANLRDIQRTLESKMSVQQTNLPCLNVCS